MDIKQIRTENLRRAIKMAGNMTILSDKTDTDISYYSQCLSAKTEKTIGPTVSRRVEKALGLENGWMDVQHGEVADEQGEYAAELDYKFIIGQLNDKEREDLLELAYLMIRQRKIVEKYTEDT